MPYKDSVRSEGLDGFPGFLMKKRGYRHESVLPKWGDSNTMFRAFPAVTNGQEEPWRISGEPNDFGEQMRVVYMVRSWGVQEKLTFIVTPKDGDPSMMDPVTTFYRAIKGTLSQPNIAYPRAWNAWINDVKQNAGAALTPPKAGVALQGGLLQDSRKKYQDALGNPTPKVPMLLFLGSSARTSMEALLNQEVPGYNGPVEDYAHRFAMGDIFSAARGCAFNVCKAPRSANERDHYNVTSTNQPMPIPIEVVAQYWTPWDSLLNYMSAAEIVTLVERAFPPEAVDYALGTTCYNQYMSDRSQGAWQRYLASISGATSPGFTPPPQVNQAAGYPPAQATPFQAPVGGPPATPAWPVVTPQQGSTTPAPTWTAPIISVTPVQAPSAPVPFATPPQAPVMSNVSWNGPAPVPAQTPAPAVSWGSASAPAPAPVAAPVGDPKQSNANIEAAKARLLAAQQKVAAAGA